MKFRTIFLWDMNSFFQKINFQGNIKNNNLHYVQHDTTTEVKHFKILFLVKKEFIFSYKIQVRKLKL